jgi:SAM-dependent methyltransferase
MDKNHLLSSKDIKTAQAFATSWNNLPQGSVYTFEQFEEWVAPLTKSDFEGKSIIELGCGNASLLVHTVRWNPKSITGVDLGDSVQTAKKNLKSTGFKNHTVAQADLTEYQTPEGFDVAYCIGVIHHLKEPEVGFKALLKNTKSGGRFHGWVYAKEGNAIVIYLVDPLRKIASKLPWWFTKYLLATPLSALFYAYTQLVTRTPFHFLPLYSYCRWIVKRDFLFFRHVAFDQLVTPQTAYITKATIETWLQDDSIVPNSSYIIFRNGNSWKFGGIKK